MPEPVSGPPGAGEAILSGPIAVTGATGFIGSRLVEALASRGHAVVALTRRPAPARAQFPPALYPRLTLVPYEPLRPGPWSRALEGCAAVVHLAGAPIAGRWTPEFRQAIRDSRQTGTRVLLEAISRLSDPPRVLISASACRYYGSSLSAQFDESSPPGPASDYLAHTCVLWEREAQSAADLGLRVAILRFGIALGLTPAFRRVLPGLRRFMGGRIGSGQQWVSWIHRDDAVAIVLRALDEPSMSGPWNATGPNPVRMDTVTASFGAAGGGLFRLPVPGFLIERMLGDGATVILEGQQVLPRRLMEAGFTFRHPRIGPAVAAILR